MKAGKTSPGFKTCLCIAMLFASLIELQAKPKITSTTQDNIAARLTRYEVKTEFQEAFRKAISELVFYSLSSPGNILSEGYYEQDKPGVMWLIERWDNQAARDKFRSSIPFKTLDSLSKIGTLRPNQVMHVKDLEPLSKNQWRSQANKADEPITIMLFVDSKVGTEQQFKDAYHAAMPQFRGEAGVINYQLSQFEDDSSRFVTYEKFRSKDAFQYHLNFPPIKPVIDYLNSSIKTQPFQTGLRTLIEFAPLIRESPTNINTKYHDED